MIQRARLLIVDEHPHASEGLSGMLRIAFDVVGVADSNANAVAAVTALAPDVVLLRRSSAGGPIGTELIEWLADRRPPVRIAVVGSAATGVDGDLALRRRGVAIIDPTASSADLLAAITAAQTESPHVPPPVIASGCSPAPVGARMVQGLTPRELAVMRHLAGGLTNEAIGATMGITARGVHFHRTNIRRKLDLHSDAALIRFALLTQIRG